MLFYFMLLLIFEALVFYAFGAIIAGLLATFCAAVCFYLIWVGLPANTCMNHFWRRNPYPLWKGSRIYRMDTDTGSYYFIIKKTIAYKEFYQPFSRVFIER